MLLTSIIHVQTNDGTMVLFRVLLDHGSQASFITEEATQMLVLSRERIDAEISGLIDDWPKLSNQDSPVLFN